MRWEPDRTPPAIGYAPPPFWTAVRRGAANRCPVCGQGRVFNGYLTLVTECSHCHAPIGKLRADDAPPYFTILLAGHLLVPIVLWIEKYHPMPMWLNMVVWLPAFTLVCMALLRPVKGAVVGWMMKLGFNGAEHGPDPLAHLSTRPVVKPAVVAPDR